MSSFNLFSDPKDLPPDIRAVRNYIMADYACKPGQSGTGIPLITSDNNGAPSSPFRENATLSKNVDGSITLTGITSDSRHPVTQRDILANFSTNKPNSPTREFGENFTSDVQRRTVDDQSQRCAITVTFPATLVAKIVAKAHALPTMAEQGATTSRGNIPAPGTARAGQIQTPLGAPSEATYKGI